MNQHPIALLIEKADKAINQEDFDTVVDLYAEDAVLVIKPGKTAVGKSKSGGHGSYCGPPRSELGRATGWNGDSRNWRHRARIGKNAGVRKELSSERTKGHVCVQEGHRKTLVMCHRQLLRARSA